MTVNPADLASYDEEEVAWVTDGGTYKLVVAASSRDPRGEVAVDVDRLVRKTNDVLKRKK